MTWALKGDNFSVFVVNPIKLDPTRLQIGIEMAWHDMDAKWWLDMIGFSTWLDVISLVLSSIAWSRLGASSCLTEPPPWRSCIFSAPTMAGNSVRVGEAFAVRSCFLHATLGVDRSTTCRPSCVTEKKCATDWTPLVCNSTVWVSSRSRMLPYCNRFQLLWVGHPQQLEALPFHILKWLRWDQNQRYMFARSSWRGRDRQQWKTNEQ